MEKLETSASSTGVFDNYIAEVGKEEQERLMHHQKQGHEESERIERTGEEVELAPAELVPTHGPPTRRTAE